MQKLFIYSGVGYPTSSVVSVTPESFFKEQHISNYDETNFTASVSELVSVYSRIVFSGVRNTAMITTQLENSPKLINFLEYEPFMDWLSEQSLKSGKDPVIKFKASVAKIFRIRALIEESKKQEEKNKQSAQNMQQVIENTAVEKPAVFELGTVENESGVSLDVAIKQLEDEPSLPFEPSIVVQPELQTETLVNEQLEEFNTSLVSDEDIMTLRKKEAFVNKYIKKYIEEFNNIEPEEVKFRSRKNGPVEEMLDYIERAIRDVEKQLFGE